MFGCFPDGCLPERFFSWDQPSRRVHTEFQTVHASAARLRRLPSQIPIAHEQRKVIYLVRHAEALHNVQEQRAQKEAKRLGGNEAEMETARKNVLHNPAFWDASLSPDGRDQVRAASCHFETLLSKTHYPKPEMIFVSPLERTLQTAMLLFPKHEKVYAMEFLREKRTGLPCDERKPVQESLSLFPTVDFTNVEETDAEGSDGYIFRKDLTEENEDVAVRATYLLDFLRCQPSCAIAVVTHKGFLRELSKGPMKDILDLEGGQMPSVFGNAEVRVCEVTWDVAGEASVQLRSLEEATVKPPMIVSSNAPTPVPTRQVSRDSSDLELPSGGGLRMAAGESDAEDAFAAAVEAWRAMNLRLGGAPTFALVFCNCSVDAAAVAAALRPHAGAAVVLGGSSTHGALTKRGVSKFSVLGFRGLGWHYGLGSAGCANGADARRAGASAARVATRSKKRPDLLFISVAPGNEEAVLEGIRDVCGEVPVFGGSSADDSVLGQSENGIWWQLCGSLEGWHVLDDGVVLAALWLYEDANVSCFLSHCYGPGDANKRGTISKASGRMLSAIDGRPAAQVLNEWLDGALEPQLKHGGLVQMRTIVSPLAVPNRSNEWSSLPQQLQRLLPGSHQSGNEVRLVHVRAVVGDQLECYAPVALGDVRLLEAKPSDASGALHALVLASIERAQFQVKGAVVNMCAGFSSLLHESQLKLLAEAFPQELEIFCFFSFGETGTVDGLPSFGNLMINIALFG